MPLRVAAMPSVAAPVMTSERRERKGLRADDTPKVSGTGESCSARSSAPVRDCKGAG